MPKDSKVLLEAQVTPDQVEHQDQLDLQDTKDLLVKWDQKEDLVSPEVKDPVDHEDAREMPELQDLEVDLVALEMSAKTVFKEPLDQLVHQAFEDKMEKQEHLVQPVSLE